MAKKKIIYIDMDDVLCDFFNTYLAALKQHPEIKYPQSQIGFFRDLPPIKNAIESVKYLVAQEHFDVYILTAPSIKNPHCYTEKRLWVENYLGIDMVKKLIISCNKGLNKGDYLIDDYIEGKGQENFEGKILHFGSEEYLNWEEIIYYFNRIKC